MTRNTPVPRLSIRMISAYLFDQQGPLLEPGGVLVGGAGGR